MGRPLSDHLDFFPHDCNASTSEDKINVMRELYGNDGYAFYFICLEAIYAHILQDGSNPYVLDSTRRKIMVRRVRVSGQRFDEMLEAAISIGLFKLQSWKSGKILTSDSIESRAKKIFTAREGKRKLRAQSGQDKP